MGGTIQGLASKKMIQAAREDAIQKEAQRLLGKGVNPRLVERLFGKLGCTIKPDTRSAIQAPAIHPKLIGKEPEEAAELARRMATKVVDQKASANLIKGLGTGFVVLTAVTIGWEIYNRHHDRAAALEEPTVKYTGSYKDQGVIMKKLKQWGLVDSY